MDILLILFLSFAPMFLYALILWWFDRYEKEPLPLLVAAFLWGAIPSIILALILELILDIPIVAVSPNQLTYELLGASVVAPVVEEGIKALALLILLLFLRREIDSPMDGLIYGGIVGFGFAAVENVFYLFGAYTEGGLGSVLSLAFLRTGIFGLNHAMYTGFTGLGIALSLEIRKKALKPVLIAAGFVVALATHALHNALATFTGYNEGLFTLLIAVILDWGGVLMMLAVIGWTFILERRRIIVYAEELVNVHVIPKNEVDVLKSTLQRRLARLNMLFSGDVKRWATTRRYHYKVTKAAFAWHRLNNGDSTSRQRLKQLETQFLALREALVPNNQAAVE